MPDFNEQTDDFGAILGTIAGINPLGAIRNPSNVYSPCWCGSGKKWKFCHKIRDKQRPVSFGEFQAFKQKFFTSGTCLHPNASATTCSSSAAIQSHTVQRSGGLEAIAEKGHVYSIKKGFQSIGKNSGIVDMEDLGIGRASVFPGFCSHHDTVMFKPVESQGAVLNEKNAFLLSFRSISYELATKAASLRANVASRETIDAGRPFEVQVAVQNYMYFDQKAIRKGLDDVTQSKSQYDRAFLANDLSNFSFYGITFDGKLPFAASGAFMPEIDFSGNTLQDLATVNPANEIALNVTDLGGNSCAVFGWFGGPDCPAARLVRSFEALPDSHKADALLLLSLEQLENIYFTPSWWDGLAASVSARLHQSIAVGMPGTVRAKNALVSPFLGAITCQILTRHGKHSS